MTRKHFESLASSLRAHAYSNANESQDYQTGFASALAAVVEACKAMNPQFDADRFIAAATPTPKVRANAA